MIDGVLYVWDKGGSWVHAIPEDEPQIREAVQLLVLEREYLPGAGQDKLLNLTTIAGELYCILASHVGDWKLTTRASRARARALCAELDAEGKTETTEQSTSLAESVQS